MFKWNRYTYRTIDHSESDDELLGKPKSTSRIPHSSHLSTWLSGISIALITATCLGVIVWWPYRLLAALDAPYINHDEVLHHCGQTHTVKEAKALGCKWDLLAAAWLPPACIDQELTDQFRKASQKGPWHYYAEKDGSDELQEEDLQYRVGENQTYFTTLRYHRTHCDYQWRKMHRAWQRGTWIEDQLAAYHHTKHCGFVGLQEAELEDLATEISVEFMNCYATYPY